VSISVRRERSRSAPGSLRRTELLDLHTPGAAPKVSPGAVMNRSRLVKEFGVRRNERERQPMRHCLMSSKGGLI
jgi:hypothetical protein